MIHTPDLWGNLRFVIDGPERIDMRIYAHGAQPWTEDELAGLVDIIDLPRHPLPGWRVDEVQGRVRIQRGSQDSARDRDSARR